MYNPISILIVDDHEVVRNGIRSYLETLPDFEVVGEAESGEEALKLVSELIPDVVLLDLILPGMDGVETTRRIKQITPRTQVVVLTSYHEDVHIFPALKAGAISYILKDMKMEKLVEALHRAIQNEVTLHPLVAERVLGEKSDQILRFGIKYGNIKDRDVKFLRGVLAGAKAPNLTVRQGVYIPPSKARTDGVFPATQSDHDVFATIEYEAADSPPGTTIITVASAISATNASSSIAP